MPTDVLGDLGPLCRRSDVIPLDGFRPKWLATLHALAAKNPVLVSGVTRVRTPTQQISNHFVIKRHDLFAFPRFHWPHVLLPNRLSDIQSILVEVDIAPLCCQHFAPSHPPPSSAESTEALRHPCSRRVHFKITIIVFAADVAARSDQ